MIQKLLLVIVSFVVAWIFVSANDSNYTGAIVFCLMLGSLFSTLIMGKLLPGLLLLMISLHWFQLEGISFAQYFMPVALVVTFLYILDKRDLKLDPPWVLGSVLVLGHMAAVVLLQPYKVDYIFIFINGMCFLFFALCSLVRWDSWRVQLMLNAHIGFMIVWGFIERAVSSEPRIEGPALSSTNFAVFLVVSWTIWLINGLMVHKYSRFVLATVSVLVLLVVLFSGTRMGILGMGLCGILAVLCNLFVKYERRVLQFLVYFAISLVGLAGLAVVVWQLMPDDLFLKQGLNTFLSGELDISSLGRIGAWLTALDIIQTDPMWGVGPGNFLERNKMFLDAYSFIPMADMTPRLGHAHNVFLLILSEQGFVGFTVLSSFCLIGLFFLLRYIKRTKSGFGLALLSGGVVTLFLGMFDVFPLFPSSLSWGAWYMAILYSLRGVDPTPIPKVQEAEL